MTEARVTEMPTVALSAPTVFLHPVSVPDRAACLKIWQRLARLTFGKYFYWSKNVHFGAPGWLNW